MTTPAPRLPTLDDVALAAGVSRATASRAIRDARRVTPELREAVERAIEQTGYVPNRAARSLASGGSSSLAIALAGIDPSDDAAADPYADPFFGRVVSGLARAVRAHDRDPVLLLAEGEAERRNVLRSFRTGQTAGVLLVTTHPRDPLLAEAIEAGVPAVMFGTPPDDVPISFVDVVNHEGGRLAADHLTARGARMVAAIAGPADVPSAAARLRGFRDGVARAGQAFAPVAEGRFSVESGRRAMAELLDAQPGIDGVFAANDLMALGAIQELRARGIEVPRDVAVVGFDDSFMAAISQPALTTVRQPIQEMADAMVRLLLDRLADPAARPVSALFDPRLVVRDSG